MNDEWPESMPVLKLENFHQGNLVRYHRDSSGQVQIDGNCLCLIGWLNLIFSEPVYSEALRALQRACGIGVNEVSVWNDSHSKEEILDAYERWCELLGYIEEVPV